jgi:hypothetical protein
VQNAKVNALFDLPARVVDWTLIFRQGPLPCKGTAIGKGELRLGSLVDFRGNTSWYAPIVSIRCTQILPVTRAWRHWGCTTKKIIGNMKNSFDGAKDLDGFDEISEDNQNKLIAAWESGEVADEGLLYLHGGDISLNHHRYPCFRSEARQRW